MLLGRTVDESQLTTILLLQVDVDCRSSYKR